MELSCKICIILAAMTVAGPCWATEREYMVTKAEPVAVALNFEKKLDCIMNIQPDHFQWKFYPLDKKDASNPKARISLTTSPFQLVPASKYETFSKKSTLTLQAKSSDIAGDYQCLAHYGASVIASVTWRVTIFNLTDFPYQESISRKVTYGNTVNWRCERPPIVNPKPFVDYFQEGKYFPPLVNISTESLIIPNVNASHNGVYKCTLTTLERSIESTTYFRLNAVRFASEEAPYFLVPPISEYNVTKGETAFLECAAVGNPVPKSFWRRQNGASIKHKTGFGGLIIKNVSSDDDGIYECIHENRVGNLVHAIRLNYQEPPTIRCPTESTEVHQGNNLDLDCEVFGVPRPEITWFLNGFVVTNDSKITTDGRNIHFRPAEKRHAGNVQLFARNVVGTVYRTIFVAIIPLTTTHESAPELPEVPIRENRKRPNRHNGKMYPPSKPTVSRISDESVLLRWTVLDKGLNVSFFKVQYKELGPANAHDSRSRKSSKWITTNTDISSYVRSYEVNNLKPDFYYKFRIAAVYSNDDNKNSPNSDKFHLTKLDFDNRNPLPIPIITHTEPVDSTSVKIHWKCEPTNVSIGGFYVNYNLATSAGDYTKATVDGANATSYVLSHLQPDTVYDIKLQAFTSKFASHFSHVQQVKTLALVVSSTTVAPTVPTSSNLETAGISKLYIIIAAVVVGGCGVIALAIGLVVFCRKSKQKKSATTAEGNEYVAKGASRSNGCVSNSRITITANPLADSDNKNQNMIEMSCLSSQNNNCSTVQPSVSGENSPTISRDKKHKKRSRKNDTNCPPGENYV